MSCHPSPSMSRKRPPAPSVSGRYFFPNAPLLWTNLMPAGIVTSVKVIDGAADATPTRRSGTPIDQARSGTGTSIRRNCARASRVRSLGAHPAVPVNLLALVVVVGRAQTVRTGNRLGRFVGLESRIKRLLARGERRVADTLVAEHEIVVRLEIFGIDQEHLSERRDGVVEPPLQEMNPSDLVEHDAVARILLGSDAQVIERFVITSEC